MTDTGHLNVNFARLYETSSHISNAIAALESQLDEVEQAAAPLVQTWAGDAQQAYQDRQATWRQAAADLARMLAAVRRSLDESLADYQSTERHNASLFAR